MDGGDTLGFNLFFLLERDAERISSITFRAAANGPDEYENHPARRREGPRKQTKRGPLVAQGTTGGTRST